MLPFLTSNSRLVNFNVIFCVCMFITLDSNVQVQSRVGVDRVVIELFILHCNRSTFLSCSGTGLTDR